METNALVLLINTTVVYQVPFFCDVRIASGRLNGDNNRSVLSSEMALVRE